MTNQEWQDYVEAFNLLTTTPHSSGSGRSIYEQFAYEHDVFAEHSNNLFLAWHREMLWKWDVALNSVKPGVAQPYFDWSVSSADIFSDRMFLADRLGGSVSTSGNQEAPIPDGSFQGLQSGHPSQHAVTRNYNNDPLATSTIVDATVNDINAFENFRLVVEFDIHNAFHRAIGGDMVRSYSPNEPFFYFHHAFIDYIYRRWEGRGSVGSNTESELGMQMRPWSETTRDVLEGPATTCVSYEGLGSGSSRFLTVGRQAVAEDVKFDTASEKVDALEVVAQKKVEDPTGYKNELNLYKRIQDAAYAAAVELNRDLGQLAAAQKITATLLLREGVVDVSEADEVLAESDEEVKQDGETDLVELRAGSLPDDVPTEDVKNVDA